MRDVRVESQGDQNAHRLNVRYRSAFGRAPMLVVSTESKMSCAGIFDISSPSPAARGATKGAENMDC